MHTGMLGSSKKKAETFWEFLGKFLITEGGGRKKMRSFRRGLCFSSGLMRRALFRKTSVQANVACPTVFFLGGEGVLPRRNV